MYLDSDTNKQVNHISHDVQDIKQFKTDGSPIPHYFRKALDEYTHDLDSPDNKISDPSAARQQVAMDKPNIGTEISTKGKVSTDYIKSLIDNKNLGPSKIKLLTGFITNKIDYRTLLRLKTHLFDTVQGEEISVDQWNNCKDRYLHIFPENVEKDLLAEITVSKNFMF